MLPNRSTVPVSEYREEDMPHKRELIEPHAGDKRYVRRDDQGRFTDDQVNVGRSLADDVRQHAKKIVPPGQGNRGDQRRRP